MGMDGMVDAATMDRLPTLTGTAFDELWLRSMITHHQGAVAMAEPEIARGENPTAVKMAKVIVDWQQLEIGRMHAMLGQRSDLAPTRRVIDTQSALPREGWSHDNL